MMAPQQHLLHPSGSSTDCIMQVGHCDGVMVPHVPALVNPSEMADDDAMTVNGGGRVLDDGIPVHHDGPIADSINSVTQTVYGNVLVDHDYLPVHQHALAVVQPAAISDGERMIAGGDELVSNNRVGMDRDRVTDCITENCSGFSFK